MPSITAIFASTSGHTEFVLDTVIEYWKSVYPELNVRTIRAEVATEKDLHEANVLLLGSGTWNTGGVEGQLNPYMHALLFERLKDVQLEKKPVFLISLGDDRYYFTTRCTERFMQFLKQANGVSAAVPLVILNEPYAQKERIHKWAAAAAEKIRSYQ